MRRVLQVAAGAVYALAVLPAFSQAAYDIGSEANFAQVQKFQHGSVYYLGKVAMPGGVLPWDPIPVVVECGGVPRFNTQTNAKGEFRLQPPPSTSEMGVSNNNPNHVTAASLAGCKVKAKLEGFTSSTLNVISNTMMDNADLGTVVLKRDELVKGTAESASTLAAPPEYQKLYMAAENEDRSGHPQKAEALLQQAVTGDSQFAEAWYQLGRLQERQNPEKAIVSLNKAVAADPDFVSPFVHIAAVEASRKHWQESLTAVRQALKLDPTGTPQLWYYGALANLNMNKPQFAVSSAEASLALDPSHLWPNTEHLLAVALAREGHLPEAIQHLRNTLTYTAPGPGSETIQKQIAELQKAEVAAAKPAGKQ